MEFVQILFILVAMLIVLVKPAFERTAFVCLWAGWLFMMWFYVGHTSANLFGLVNL